MKSSSRQARASRPPACPYESSATGLASPEAAHTTEAVSAPDRDPAQLRQHVKCPTRLPHRHIRAHGQVRPRRSGQRPAASPLGMRVSMDPFICRQVYRTSVKEMSTPGKSIPALVSSHQPTAAKVINRRSHSIATDDACDANQTSFALSGFKMLRLKSRGPPKSLLSRTVNGKPL